MANSRIPGLEGSMHSRLAVPARTPGPLGFNDAADPNVTTRLGDTPGPLGMNDYADPTLPRFGSLAAPTPNFWTQVTEQRWADASKNLANFGDAYPTRRKLEAGLIDAAIAAAGVAK